MVRIDKVPLTANGKVDRRSLPAPERQTVSADRSTEVLMTADQQRVATIWRSILGVGRVSLTDNFFDLGGHSLLVTRLHTALEGEFGRQVPLVELFRLTTVSAQAGMFATQSRDSSALDRAKARAARQLLD
jgi:acyl carrier protein